jgi:hypothetical protein
MSSRFVAGLCKGWVWVLLIGIGATGWSGRVEAEVGPDCPWVENWEDEKGVKVGIYGAFFSGKRYSFRTKAMANLAEACGASHEAEVFRKAINEMRFRAGVRWFTGTIAVFLPMLPFPDATAEERAFIDKEAAQKGAFFSGFLFTLTLMNLAENENPPYLNKNYRDVRNASKGLNGSFRSFQAKVRTEQQEAQALVDMCHSDANSFIESFKLAENCKALRLMLPQTPKMKPWLADLLPRRDSIGDWEAEHLLAYISGEFADKKPECEQAIDVSGRGLSNLTKNKIASLNAQAGACHKTLGLFTLWSEWGGFSTAVDNSETVRAAETAIEQIAKSTGLMRDRLRELEERIHFGEAVSHCRQAKASVLPTSGKSPNHTSPHWPAAIKLCTTTLNLWSEQWPKSEQRELQSWIKKIKSKKRNEERAAARKKAKKSKEGARIIAEWSRYRSRCERECRSWGNRTKKWECRSGRISGTTVPRRGHKSEGMAMPGGWDWLDMVGGGNLNQSKCKCVPNVRLPDGCTDWIVY